MGKNVQAAASDKRAEDTYKGAEAVLHEAIEIHKRLASQDEAITEAVDKLRGMVALQAGAAGGDLAGPDYRAAERDALTFEPWVLRAGWSRSKVAKASGNPPRPRCWPRRSAPS